MKEKQKKESKRLLQNKATWKENRDKILESVKNEKKSLDEIKSQTLLSKTTILNHIEKLESTHLIKEELVKTDKKRNKIVYSITEKGRETINPADIKLFLRYLEDIENNDGQIIYDYSELGLVLAICSLPWGINSHLIINKKLEKLELLKRNDVAEIEKLLYKKIRKNIRNTGEHQVQIRTDALRLLKKDRFVLGFNIDLAKVYKSIEKKSLETLESMSEEEIASRFQADIDWMENIDDVELD